MKIVAWIAGIVGAVIAAVISHWAIEHSGVFAERAEAPSYRDRDRAEHVTEASRGNTFYYFCFSFSFAEELHECASMRQIVGNDIEEASDRVAAICKSQGFNGSSTQWTRTEARNDMDETCR